jgi:hypothetical protein
MYDIFNNHRVIKIFSGTQSNQSAVYGPLDMWEHAQLPNRALLMIDVIGSVGEVDVKIVDSVDDQNYNDLCEFTIPAEDELYLIDVVDFERYLEFEVDVVGTTGLGIFLITFEDQRRKVTQDHPILVPAYLPGHPAFPAPKGRTPKVAVT